MSYSSCKIVDENLIPESLQNNFYYLVYSAKHDGMNSCMLRVKLQVVTIGNKRINEQT